MVTDNGTQFKSHQMVKFIQDQGIKHLTVALYSPSSNGLVERINRFLKEGIQTALSGGLQVEEFLKQKLWCYHITPHSTTGVSPFQLLRNRVANSHLCPHWVKVLTTSPSPSQDTLQTVKDAVRSKQYSVNGASSHPYQSHSLCAKNSVVILINNRCTQLTPNSFAHCFNNSWFFLSTRRFWCQFS